jgi:hypothetical protein
MSIFQPFNPTTEDIQTKKMSETDTLEISINGWNGRTVVPIRKILELISEQHGGVVVICINKTKPLQALTEIERAVSLILASEELPHIDEEIVTDIADVKHYLSEAIAKSFAPDESQNAFSESFSEVGGDS